MIGAASEELRERVKQLLEELDISAVEPDPNTYGQVFSTPRRLAVMFPDVGGQQPDARKVVTGPSMAIAYKDGQPTAAVHAFAKKVGQEVSQLIKKPTDKGEYVAAIVVRKGRSSVDLLAEALPKELSAIYWPKNMYWQKPNERFVRPVRWLVALLDGERIPLEFDGIRAGKTSRGHRILSDGAVTISHAGRPIMSLCEQLRFWAAENASTRFARRSTRPRELFQVLAGAKIKLCSIPL